MQASAALLGALLVVCFFCTFATSSEHAPRAAVVLRAGKVNAATKVSKGPYCNNNNCPNSDTCCTMDNGSPGCCAYLNATCCGVNNTCCPHGTICDPVEGTCVTSSPSEFCAGCEAFVGFVEDKGCDALCTALPPPLDVGCEFINLLGVCSDIIGWISNGQTELQICSSLGACSGGTCKCAYCTRWTHGRCLSVPNHCPNLSPREMPGRIIPAPKHQKTSVERNLTADPELCLDGFCYKGYEGCCLTCF